MTEKRRIRVAIVDDHEMIRAGLAIFLQAFDDLELVGSASDGAEALALCLAVKPDVVLMDLIMPRVDGIAATRAIRQSLPATQVIAISSFADEALVREALAQGAVSYLLKDALIDALAGAIRAAAQVSNVQASVELVSAASDPDTAVHMDATGQLERHA